MEHNLPHAPGWSLALLWNMHQEDNHWHTQELNLLPGIFVNWVEALVEGHSFTVAHMCRCFLCLVCLTPQVWTLPGLFLILLWSGGSPFPFGLKSWSHFQQEPVIPLPLYPSVDHPSQMVHV